MSTPPETELPTSWFAPREAAARLFLGLMLAAAVLISILVFAGAASAANEVTITANISSMQPTEGDFVSIQITVHNNLNASLGGFQVIVYQGTNEFGRLNAVSVPAGGDFTQYVNGTARIPNVIDNDKGLTLRAQSASGLQIYGDTTYPAFKVQPRALAPPTDYTLPAVVAAIAVVGVLGAIILLRRKKEEAARLAAEAAAKATVDARLAAEAAREAAISAKVKGKYPAEYYQRKRVRLATLIPSGLTSAGVTVLQPKANQVTKVVYSCPRCGTHKGSFEAACPRCTVQAGIDALRADVRRHRGADLTDVSDLMQQAEFQLSYSSFEEAQAIVDKARSVVTEILGGGERIIKFKRIETISAVDSHPKVLDLGLGTQHTTVDEVKEEQDYEAREEYAREGSHCPTCGHAMYGELCAYCNFDAYVTLVNEAVASAAKAGADTVEPKDLVERAIKLRDEGSKSSASRYLNRARFLSKKHAQDHFAQKAEGMIDYARALMLAGEQDGLTADFQEAERLIEDADAKRQSGDAEAAIDVIARAEASITAALHMLSKEVAIRRIDAVAGEIDTARGKGVTLAAPEAKLKSARAAFDAGDFEKAGDEAAEARAEVVEAAKGKTVCPKCEKPVQPTWARCPYCTTPLK